jgi:hypothetical protein
MEGYFKSSYHFRNPYNLSIRGPGLWKEINLKRN